MAATAWWGCGTTESDVEAGRIEATVLVSAMSDPAFRSDFASARAELRKALALSPLNWLLSNGGPARATLRDNLTIKELNLIRENQLCSGVGPE